MYSRSIKDGRNSGCPASVNNACWNNGCNSCINNCSDGCSSCFSGSLSYLLRDCSDPLQDICITWGSRANKCACRCLIIRDKSGIRPFYDSLHGAYLGR